MVGQRGDEAEWEQHLFQQAVSTDISAYRPGCKASWIKRGFGACSSAPRLLLEMWISCNTDRPACNFLQALRSQCPPALASRQILPGSDTKPKSVFFQLSFNCVSPSYYLIHSTVRIKMSPGKSPSKNEMHRDLCQVTIASLESWFCVLLPGSYLWTASPCTQI